MPRISSTLSRCRIHSLSNPKSLSREPVAASESKPLPPKRSVELSHQWPEWSELLELLLKKGFLNVDAFDGSKNSSLIRSACLDFARDHLHLIRYFSRRDIHLMAGAGCPTLDRKVVNSGKRLRAHVGINEGDVCSSCSLRSSCEQAYVKANEDENGRTVDVMRYLSMYGLDFNTGSSNKYVKESVRKLMKEMVEFSDKQSSLSLDRLSAKHQMPDDQKPALMKQGDWICPKCDFMNFAKNFKCLRCSGIFQEKVNKLREENEHLPLKKGDWICDKCYFFNFAKNTRCIQCDEKPPKRNLNPGEWECELCNYINFKKNVICIKCSWNRQKASNKKPAISFVCESENDIHNHYSQRKYSSDEEHSNYSICEEDKTDDETNSTSWNKFVDNFPIVGGSSVISKDDRLKEMWKERMLKKQEFSLVDVEVNVNQKEICVPDCLKFDECDDDDDIAGWFKPKREK